MTNEKTIEIPYGIHVFTVMDGQFEETDRVVKRFMELLGAKDYSAEFFPLRRDREQMLQVFVVNPRAGYCYMPQLRALDAANDINFDKKIEMLGSMAEIIEDFDDLCGYSGMHSGDVRPCHVIIVRRPVNAPGSPAHSLIRDLLPRLLKTSYHINSNGVHGLCPISRPVATHLNTGDDGIKTIMADDRTYRLASRFHSETVNDNMCMGFDAQVISVSTGGERVLISRNVDKLEVVRASSGSYPFKLAVSYTSEVEGIGEQVLQVPLSEKVRFFTDFDNKGIPRNVYMIEPDESRSVLKPMFRKFVLQKEAE